jgi:hypothetical protein
MFKFVTGSRAATVKHIRVILLDGRQSNYGE